MTEEEFRSNVPAPSVDEQIGLEAEAPKPASAVVDTSFAPAISALDAGEANEGKPDAAATADAVNESAAEDKPGATNASGSVAHSEGIIERVECVLEAGVKEAEALIGEVEAFVEKEL